MTGFHSLQFLMEILHWTIAGPLALQILDWKDTQHLIKCSTVTLMLLAHTQREVRKTWWTPWAICWLFQPGSSCPDLVFRKCYMFYLPDLKWNIGTCGRQKASDVGSAVTFSFVVTFWISCIYGVFIPWCMRDQNQVCSQWYMVLHPSGWLAIVSVSKSRWRGMQNNYILMFEWWCRDM